MAEEQKQNQDQVDGDILDLAVSVLERRGIGMMSVHDLRGHSRSISGSREFTSMVQITGYDVEDFIKCMAHELRDQEMFASATSAFQIGSCTMIFLKTTCTTKLMEAQFRGILRACYKNINLLTNLNPTELNLCGLKDSQ